MNIIAKGTKIEQKLFTEVNSHYEMAKEDLENRYADWDKKLELFRSYINEADWPYSSQVFVPQVFTALYEKMGRLNGGKPRGRLIPRKGGNIMKAKINNELLNFQWDDSTRVDRDPMVSKWAKMDLNTRIYGASFALVKWRYETRGGRVIFDGPVMRVLNNRDCLPNPAYSTIRNWFQFRDYLTLQELENVNDISSQGPQYKNLSKLKASIKDRSVKGGDNRDRHYTPKMRELAGLSDYLGKDENPEFVIVEVVTEYQEDRKIVFAPQHGVILQDTKNPYKHKQIPVVCLKYISVDDDIYGLSEIEPIEKVQKAMNALTSQYIDSINMDLYRIMMVNTVGVQMHTLEWGPGKKWLMNNPGKDVVPLDHSMTATNQFVNVYSVLVSMMKEGLGETSGAFSTLKPFSSEKTATEINKTETTKSIRDNFNQIFLSEAIKEQMMFWLMMNKQFIFKDPYKQQLELRVTGRDSMQEFKSMGLDQFIPDTSEGEMMGAEASILAGGMGEVPVIPKFPVSIGGEMKPKFEMDESGEMGTLYMVSDDMVGSYDYIADVESMRVNSSIEDKMAKMEAFSLVMNPQVQQILQTEGKKVKVSDLLIDIFDASGIKDAEKYFEVIQQPEMMGAGIGGQNGIPTEQGGAGSMQAGGVPQNSQRAGGMANPRGMAQRQGVSQLG